MKVLIFIFTLSISNLALASNAVVVSGDGYLFSVDTPKGWSPGYIKNQGLNVFFPKNGSWADSPAVMYIRSMVKRQGAYTPKQLVETNYNTMKVQAKKLIKKELKALMVENRKAHIVEWLNNVSPFERAAYMDQSTWIIQIILSSKTKKDYEKALPAFQKLVQSYSYHSDEPQYEVAGESKLKKLIKKADKHMKKKGVTKWDINFTQAMGQFMANTMKRCLAGIKKPKPVDIVALFDKSGVIEKAYWADNKQSECFAKSGLLKGKYPPTPFDNLYYRIHIKITE